LKAAFTGGLFCWRAGPDESAGSFGQSQDWRNELRLLVVLEPTMVGCAIGICLRVRIPRSRYMMAQPLSRGGTPVWSECIPARKRSWSAAHFTARPSGIGVAL